MSMTCAILVLQGQNPNITSTLYSNETEEVNESFDMVSPGVHRYLKVISMCILKNKSNRSIKIKLYYS